MMNKLMIFIILNSYFVFAEEIKVSTNIVKVIVNEGLSKKTINNFLESYRKSIISLENQLRRTVSIEEKYRISEKLDEAKHELNKKKKEIQSLNAFIETSNAKVTRVASKLYKEKGLSAVLDYFKGEKFKQFEKNSKKNIKELVAGYRMNAKTLELDNKYDEAKEFYKKALDYNRTIDTLFDYAYFLQGQHDFDEAIKIYEITLLELDYPIQEAVIKDKNSLVRLLNNLALLYYKKKKFNQAEMLNNKVLRINASILNKKLKLKSSNLGISFNNLANIYTDKNEFKKAEKNYLKALELYESLNTKTTKALYYKYRSSTLNGLGILYEKEKKYIEAEEVYKEALVLRRKSSVNHVEFILESLSNLGLLYQYTEQFKKAELFYKEALDIAEKVFDSNFKVYNIYMANILHNMGFLYAVQNKFEKSKHSYHKSLLIYKSLAKKYPNIYNDKVAMSFNNLANLYSQNRKFKKAKELYVESIEFYKLLSKKNPKVYLLYLIKVQGNFASFLYDLEEFDKAEKIYLGIWDVYKNLKTPKHIYDEEVSQTLNDLGLVYLATKQYLESIKMYKEALILNSKNTDVYYNMAKTYCAFQDYNKAINAYIELLNINPNDTEVYVNLFELQLIQNLPFTKKLEAKYISLFQNQKSIFIYYEMLKVLQELNKKDINSIEIWNKKYIKVDLEWDFIYLDNWVETLKNKKKQEEIKQVVNFFKAHSKKIKTKSLK